MLLQWLSASGSLRRRFFVTGLGEGTPMPRGPTLTTALGTAATW